MDLVVRLATSRPAKWIMFFTGVCAAWALLYLMHLPKAQLVDSFGAGILSSLCITEISFVSLLTMWTLMSGAMMAPTAVPMLVAYEDIRHTGAGSNAGYWALISGYLVAWVGFAAVAAFTQKILFDARLLNVAGQSISPFLTAGLLALAGAYQFTSMKQSCLTACQSPLMAFLGTWKPGAFAAFKMGLREGAFCLGCCWALMMLAFVGGTMNLAFMGLGMALMTLEKLSDIGDYISKPLGVILLLAASWVVYGVL